MSRIQLPRMSAGAIALAIGFALVFAGEVFDAHQEPQQACPAQHQGAKS